VKVGRGGGGETALSFSSRTLFFRHERTTRADIEDRLTRYREMLRFD
jgi:hypothetical protein